MTGCAKSQSESKTKKNASDNGKTIVASVYSADERRIKLLKLLTEAASSKGGYKVDLRVITEKDMGYDKYLLKLNKELSLGEVDLVFGNMEKIINLTPSKVTLEPFYEKNRHIFKSFQYKYMIPIFANIEQVVYDQKALEVKGLDSQWNASEERALVLSQFQKGEIDLNYTNIVWATSLATQKRMFVIENQKLIKNTKEIDAQLQWIKELMKSAKNVDWDSFETKEWNADERIAGAPKVDIQNILFLSPEFEFSAGYQMIYQVDENPIYPHVYGAYINNWNEQIEVLMTYLVSEEAQLLTEVDAVSPAGHISDVNPENFEIIADHKQASEYQRKVFKSMNEAFVKKLNNEEPLTYEESYGLMSQKDIQYQLLMAYHKNGEAGMNLQVDEWEAQLNKQLDKMNNAFGN